MIREKGKIGSEHHQKIDTFVYINDMNYRKLTEREKGGVGD
jgi:hypothetical protein